MNRAVRACLAVLGSATLLITAPPSTAAQGATRVITDIPYAPADPPTSRGHLLDLYLPQAPHDAPWPLLIWTGGSGWMADNGKDSAGPIAQAFNPRGYAVAGVSIRSSSQVQFPGQLHDIKAAIRWLRAHAREHRLDTRRFAIMGDSSGGWTTAMAALTGDVPALAGNVGVIRGSSAVQAAVAFYPPTDFLQMDEQMLPGACASFNETFGLTDCHDDPASPESLLVGCPIQTCPRAAQAANPVNYVSRRDPPIMILHGQQDTLVPHAQSILLYNALRAKGSEATFFSVPGAGHDWQQVLDPANHTGHTVYRTRDGSERITVGAPDPSWDTIDRFLRQAFRR
ncbi:alpha/beta hydrolase [Actinoplanes sp. NBC_00393]|uniref:alpha/beta hydrolase n=1 Tax=Actinoplanes sp. NBC_00393 TaxID=2975953 RepID=UPI002E23E46B